MYKKSLLFIVCSLGFLAITFAQTPSTQNDVSNLKFIRPQGPTLSELANYGKVNRTVGTPYLYDEYAPGRIRFEGQTNLSEILDVLIDLENNQLFIQLSTGFIGEFPMEYLDEVTVYGPEGDTLTYEVHNTYELFGEGDRGRRFYRVLHRGDKYLLLHQPIKYLRKEEYVENLGMVRRPDKYMERNQYWLFDGGSLIEIKKNQRAIERAMPSKASAIKRMSRVNDLNLKEEADIGRLFALLEGQI